MRDSTFVYLRAAHTVGIDGAAASCALWLVQSRSGAWCGARAQIAHSPFSSCLSVSILSLRLSRGELICGRLGESALCSPGLQWKRLFFSLVRVSVCLSLSRCTKSPLAKGRILWLLQSVVVHDQSFRKSVLTIRCVLVITLCLRPFESITLWRRMWGHTDTAAVSRSSGGFWDF